MGAIIVSLLCGLFQISGDEPSHLHPSRLNVLHIPGCARQLDFNLFSQAKQDGHTDTMLFGIPGPLQCERWRVETFHLSLGTHQSGNWRVVAALCPTLWSPTRCPGLHLSILKTVMIQPDHIHTYLLKWILFARTNISRVWNVWTVSGCH